MIKTGWLKLFHFTASIKALFQYLGIIAFKINMSNKFLNNLKKSENNSELRDSEFRGGILPVLFFDGIYRINRIQNVLTTEDTENTEFILGRANAL